MLRVFATIALLLAVTLSASTIQLVKKENSDSNTTLLVIGGIHGDEEGSYFAASILAKYYDIESNNLWIVPNLNSYSIQKNSRGIYGDMNRKFSFIKEGDKDKEVIEQIKKVILDPKVSLVLNLHDGSGFYRQESHGSIFNPNAWGQSCVIDQCEIGADLPFANLGEIATSVRDGVNKKLLQDHHAYNVKNTKTRYEDEAMQLSLTYFAVTHNKPAFALESSKNLPTLEQKVFYHLLAIEEFMINIGIAYTREFELNEASLEKIINNYGKLSINNNFFLDLNNIKKTLSYIPIKSSDNIFSFSHTLGSIAREGSFYTVYIGNKKIATLGTQTFTSVEECKDSFEAEVDGELRSFKASEDIFVKNSIKIVKDSDYRVNLIGFTAKGYVDESDFEIGLKDFEHRFSLDNDGLVYRVEFYKNSDFCFMSKVHFIQD
ncbi:MAG: M99 family carboxypeptidase catalytic domain-containing protein [Sulfuricurvum sp.]